MKVIVGELWKAKADIIGVTTNAYITSAGKLVMGRGAAAEAADLCPWLPEMAAKVIEGGGYPTMPDTTISHYQRPDNPHPYRLYGFISLRTQHKSKLVRLGLYQVKWHYRDTASLFLIAYSAASLALFLRNAPLTTVALNYPGIGFGRLEEAKVASFLAGLPDSVTFYKRG